MRAGPGVVAQLRFAVLVFVLVAAAQPGPGRAPDLGKRWTAVPQQAAHVVAPLLGKRWS